MRRSAADGFQKNLAASPKKPTTAINDPPRIVAQTTTQISVRADHPVFSSLPDKRKRAAGPCSWQSPRQRTCRPPARQPAMGGRISTKLHSARRADADQIDQHNTPQRQRLEWSHNKVCCGNPCRGLKTDTAGPATFPMDPITENATIAVGSFRSRRPLRRHGPATPAGIQPESEQPCVIFKVRKGTTAV